ncbi:MAG: hypothetical protein P4L43_01000 [Syntrophobacteraceae bacterium]|nr:hypothetical protein [Syntrophobacteraceae bacterium]
MADLSVGIREAKANLGRLLRIVEKVRSTGRGKAFISFRLEAIHSSSLMISSPPII